MICPACHGTGYTTIDDALRLRKNPSRAPDRELRLPCTRCNATGAVPDPDP